jgi:hypothetical protein
MPVMSEEPGTCSTLMSINSATMPDPAGFTSVNFEVIVAAMNGTTMPAASVEATKTLPREACS